MTCERDESLSFDRNVDMDKRFVSGEPLSLEQRSSAGKEFHSIRAEYMKDWFRILLLDVTAGRQRVASLEDLVQRAG